MSQEQEQMPQMQMHEQIQMPQIQMQMPEQIQMQMPEQPKMPRMRFNKDSLKMLIVAVTNVLSKPEGQALLKSSLKIIDPTLKMFTDEVVRSIKKNKPKLMHTIKDMAIPVATVIRNAMGTIPGFSEGLAAYLAVKNVLLTTANGVNLFSATVNSFFTMPLKKIFKQTHESIVNVIKLKDDVGMINNDVTNVMKLFSQFDKEASKIQNMMMNGSNLNSLLTHNTNMVGANMMPNMVGSNMMPNMVPNMNMVGGNNIIKKSTQRINKWVRKFKGTIKNKSKLN
jgi:hypothetical protein